MKGLSKFLKNKNTVTILGVLLCLVVLYTGYTMRINQKTALTTVYYANQTIQPKTEITKDMVSKMNVPTSFIKGAYYRNYNDIVGKYSNYNTMIAEGSIFYTDLLIEEANLPDSIFYEAKEGERLISFPVNSVTTYGNSIMPNNIVDIYVKLYNDREKLVYGEMYENIEVLAVKDSTGKNVFESTDEARTPAYIYFTLPEAKYLLFSSLRYVTTNNIEIVLVPKTANFNVDDPTATEVTSEYFYKFVLDKIEQIDNQKELYDKLYSEYLVYLNEKEQKERNAQNNNISTNTTDNNENNQ